MNQYSEDYLKRWQVLCAVMTGGFMVSVDGSVVNLILPTVVKALMTDFTRVQWVVISYLLTIIGLIMIMGRLGDILGKKEIYLAGFILFTLGSLLCGLSGSVWWLIGFRVVQGIGGAMILALGFAVATQAFPPAERGKAMGMLASVVSLGVVAGPVIGGFLVKYLSWHWIFFMNLPLGCLGIYMVGKYVPSGIHSPQRSGFDIPGAVLFFLCMFLLFSGLTLAQKTAFTHVKTMSAFIMSLICAWLFLKREKSIESALIDLSIFSNRALSVNLIVLFLFYFSLSGVFVLAPFYFEDILGYAPDRIGFLFGGMSVAMAVLSPVSGILSDRMGASAVILFSLLLMLATFILMGYGIGPETTGIACVASMVLIGVSMGFYMSPSHSAVMGGVSWDHLGVVSGLLILSRTLGQTAGVAVLGTAWAGWVRFYNNGILANGITDAPVHTRIEGFRNIAFSSAALVFFALMCVLWLVNRQVTFDRIRSVQK
ncbi:MFS transporter [Desulfobacter sp.]|uniref:MFS transporter n=1 Tax=Desulfobacter sp. TaxID=2294 RepID=UPI003D0D3858